MNPTSNEVKALPFTASIPAKSSPSFFQKLWQKICSFVSGIFKAIGNAFGKLFNGQEFFSKREIRLLRDERLPQTLPLTPLTVRKVKVQKPTETNDLPSKEPVRNPEPVYNSFDKPLEDLRAFTRDFAGLGIDVLYENKMQESLKSAQDLAPSLPPFIKSIAKLLVEMGEKASKPLFKKFAEQKTQVIDPALRKIFKTLIKADQNKLRDNLTLHLAGNPALAGVDNASAYIKPIVDWISLPKDQRKPLTEIYTSKKIDQKLAHQLIETAQAYWNIQTLEKRDELYRDLQNVLAEEFKEAKVPFMHNINSDYIVPILDWLLKSDQSQPLNDSFAQMNAQKEQLIDGIFDRVISLLVEKKIDQYSTYLGTTVQRDLGDIVYQMMQKNATRITNFFSERASELISNAPFAQTIDTLIENTVHEQIQAIIASEAAYEEEKKLLAKATIHAQSSPTTPEGFDAQIRAKNHLKTVERYGGEEAYLHYMRLEKFSKHKACNPQLKQIIDQEIQSVKLGQDPSIDKKASEKAIYAAIAENLLTLMTPTRKRLGANGEVEEVDPFTELWDLLYFPEEFHNLLKQSEELTHEFVTPETTALLEKIRQPLVEIAKGLFQSTAKDMLKAQIGGLVQKGFEKLIIPENINEINADTSLPNINLILVETFAKQELARNMDDFAPAFYKLVSLNSTDRDKQIRDIQNSLIKLAKSKFRQFNPNEFYSKENGNAESPEMVLSELSPMDWAKISKSIVVEIEQSILEAKIDGQKFNPEQTSLAEIKDILKVTFSSTSKANNPFFGDLSMDVIFKMGELENGEWLIETFLKDKISKSITESVSPWRQSHDKLVDTTTEALKRNYSDYDSVKSLLLDEGREPSKLTDKKLAHQIDVMARLSHDIIMGLAQEGGWIAKTTTNYILSDNTDKLNKVITKVYKKIFSEQLINQNVVVNACDKIFESLQKAAEKVKREENMQVHQLAARYQISQEAQSVI